MIAEESSAGAGEGFRKVGIVAALPVDVSNEVTSQDRTVLYATRQDLYCALSRYHTKCNAFIELPESAFVGPSLTTGKHFIS